MSSRYLIYFYIYATFWENIASVNVFDKMSDHLVFIYQNKQNWTVHIFFMFAMYRTI